MKIIITQGCAGPAGSFSVGQKPDLDDAIAADLVRAGYAEPVPDASQLQLSMPQAASETEATPAKRARRSGKP